MGGRPNAQKDAAAKAKKKEQEAADEKAEAQTWIPGSKDNSKAEARDLKATEKALQKAQREALLAAEDAALPNKGRKPSTKKPQFGGLDLSGLDPALAAKYSQPGSSTSSGPASAVSATSTQGGSRKGSVITTPAPLSANPNRSLVGSPTSGAATGNPASPLSGDASDQPISTLNASGIDSALEALALGTGAAGGGGGGGGDQQQIDRHPERRWKAAYAAYEARRLVEMREEEKGLKRNQKIERIRKEFEKSAENPMNQANAGEYNLSKEGMAQMREEMRRDVEERLR